MTALERLTELDKVSVLEAVSSALGQKRNFTATQRAAQIVVACREKPASRAGIGSLRLQLENTLSSASICSRWNAYSLQKSWVSSLARSPREWNDRGQNPGIHSHYVGSIQSDMRRPRMKLRPIWGA